MIVQIDDGAMTVVGKVRIIIDPVEVVDEDFEELVPKPDLHYIFDELGFFKNVVQSEEVIATVRKHHDEEAQILMERCRVVHEHLGDR